MCVVVVISCAEAGAQSVPAQCDGQFQRYRWYQANGSPDEMAYERQRLDVCIADAARGVNAPGRGPSASAKPVVSDGDNELMIPGQAEEAAAKRAALEAEQARWRAEEDRRQEKAEALRLESERMLKQSKWTSPIFSALICRELVRDEVARREIRDEAELIKAGAQADLDVIIAAKQAIREALLEIRRLRLFVKRYKAKQQDCRGKLVSSLIFCLRDDTSTFVEGMDAEGCAGKGVSERVELAGYIEDLF